MMATAIRVLYVDDEPEFLEIGRQFLEESGDFTVTTSLNATEAIRLLEQEQFDAIISDYQMPGMDGIQFLVEVRTRFGPIPVVLFTGRGREDVVIRALNSGADFYLKKGDNPEVQFAELSHTIRQSISRKRVEDTLRESENRNLSLFEHSLDCVYIHDLEGNFIDANPAALALLGYTKDDILHLSFTSLVSREQLKKARETIKAIVKDGSHSDLMECRLQKKNGEFADVETKGFLILHGEKPYAILGIARDITERKRAEGALQESEAKYRIIVENANDAIYIHNFEGKIIGLNENACRMVGYDKEELIGASLRRIDPGWPLFANTDPDQQIPGGNRIFESENIRKDGSVISVEVSEKIVDRRGKGTVLAFVRDITRRKVAENALRMSEARFRSYFDMPLQGIAITSPDKGWLQVNDRICLMLGYTRDEILRKTWAEMTHPDDLAADVEQFNRILSGEIEQYTLDKRFIQKDGSEIWTSLAVGCVRKPDGNVDYFVAVLEDITGRKKVEEDLRETDARLMFALRSAKAGTWDLDFATGKLGWSPEFSELLGLPLDTTPSFETGLAALLPDDRTLVMDKIAQSKKEHGDLWTEFRILLPGGSLRWIGAAGKISHNDAGDPVRMSGICIDITERKRAMEKIQESETQLKESQRVGHLGSWGLNVVTGDLRWSDECYRIYGFSPQEFVPDYEKFWSIVHPEDLGFVEEQIDAALNDDKPYDVDFRFVRPDGETGWIHCEGEVTRDAEGKPLLFFGTQIDITDRKRAEEALRVSEVTFRTLIEASPDAIVFSDLEGTVLMQNRMAEILVGYDDGSLETGTNIQTFFPQEELGRLAKNTQIVLEQGSIHNIEYTLIRKDGTHVLVELNSTLVKDPVGGQYRFVTVLRDITKRKLAEEALRKSEHFVSSILESTPNLIYIYDLDEHRNVYANNEIVNFLGYSSEQILALGSELFANILHPDDAQTVAHHHAWMKTAKDGDIFECEYRMKHAKGTWRILRSRDVVFSRDSQGMVQQILGSTEDITKQKEADETIKSNLAEKEILLREIHHRVKNNLAGIISLIDLQIGSLTDPDQIYLFKDLETRIRSMAIVHESLYQTKDITNIHLTTYTENLTRFLFQVYETVTNVRCRIDMGEITMPVETATPCGLVMTEIVTNSLKYAFPKTFSCKEIRKEPCTISITMRREGSDYLLIIADNGVGIPDGTDVTMKHSLGLYLIRFIVKHQLRGSTEVSHGNGTSYTIRFPEPKRKERPTDE